jgi:O-acetylhomoserine (thiol)-lyase
MKLETLCLHAGYSKDPTTNACAVPIYRTASCLFNNTCHTAIS